MKILSSDQDGKGSREGGLNVMQTLLQRFPKVDAVFAINDPQAIGTDLAAKQLNRTFVITAVDGAPDIEAALKDPNSPMIQASASQDPFEMARIGVPARQRSAQRQEARARPAAHGVKAGDPRQRKGLQGLDFRAIAA